MTTIPVMPTLYGFSITKKPVFASIVQSFKSGREVLNAQQTFPLFEYELQYETLKDQTQNSTAYAPNAGYNAFEGLSELFLFCNGQYGRFVYEDLSDNSRVGQQLGVGDGTTKNFPIVETISDASSGLNFTFTVGRVNLNHAVTVYLNGVSVPSSGNWEIDPASNNQLVFVTAPGSGVVVTMDFFFYYLCRFISDEQEFDQFVKNWWTASIKFRSINAADLTVHGAHWVIFGLDNPSGATIFLDGFTAIAGNSYVVGSFGGGTAVEWNLGPLTVNLTVGPPATMNTIDAVSVSTNGSVFVGSYSNNTDPTTPEGFYYNGSVNKLNGGNNFPQIEVEGVSPDGSIAVGGVFNVATGNLQQPVWWPCSGTNVAYNLLPKLAPGSYAAPISIGSDNDTIVGVDDPTGGSNGFAVKWSIAGNTETILAGPGGYVGSSAYGISKDLTIVVGAYNFGTDTSHPCYWTGPTVTTLPTSNPGTFLRDEVATGISDNKSLICGTVTRVLGGAQAVVWRNGVLETLPDFGGLAPGTASSFARSISADGNTVSGTCSGGTFGGGCIWKYIVF